MVTVKEHPNCCGMYLMYGFYTNQYDASAGNDEYITQEFLSRMREWSYHFQGKLVEITLNNSQMENYPKLIQEMKNHGFKRVNIFINSNHNSVVNVFHRTGEYSGEVPTNRILEY